MTRELAMLVGLAVLPMIAAAQTPIGGAVSVHPEIRNAEVTVIRIRIAPHGRTTVHDVTPRVVVYLTDAHLRLTFPDGTIRVEQHKAGDVQWVPAMRHQGENLSDEPLEFLAIIPARASAAGPDTAEAGR